MFVTLEVLEGTQGVDGYERALAPRQNSARMRNEDGIIVSKTIQCVDLLFLIREQTFHIGVKHAFRRHADGTNESCHFTLKTDHLQETRSVLVLILIE